MITSFDDFFKNFEVNNNIGYLTELLVGFDEKLKISVHVDPDLKHQGNEYFKVYDSISYDKAKKISRIKFKEPSYVVHNNNDKKKNYKLVSNKKDDLIDFLNSKNRKNPELTNWEYAIILFNRRLGLPDEKTKKNLMFDKNSKYNDKYLPFDLKMPNYKNLPD